MFPWTSTEGRGYPSSGYPRSWLERHEPTANWSLCEPVPQRSLVRLALGAIVHLLGIVHGLRIRRGRHLLPQEHQLFRAIGADGIGKVHRLFVPGYACNLSFHGA